MEIERDGYMQSAGLSLAAGLIALGRGELETAAALLRCAAKFYEGSAGESGNWTPSRQPHRVGELQRG